MRSGGVNAAEGDRLAVAKHGGLEAAAAKSAHPLTSTTGVRAVKQPTRKFADRQCVARQPMWNAIPERPPRETLFRAEYPALISA